MTQKKKKMKNGRKKKNKEKNGEKKLTNKRK